MIKLFFTIFIFVILIGGYYGFGLIKTTAYRGPLSDHFDGQKFFNAEPYRKKSSFAILRWLFNRSRQPWPKHIENEKFPPVFLVVDPKEVRVTFINHSSFLIQTQKINILTDPIWSSRASPVSWFGPKRVRAPGIEFANLPKIDVVLISHNHYDHLDIATLKKLYAQFKPLFMVPLGDKKLLNDYGIQNVIEMDWWQKEKIDNMIVTFLPSQHWSSRWFDDKFKTLWGSYGIDYQGKKIYFAGDTGFSARFEEIRQRFGKPDLAFLPIGSYLPRWFMKENHLNPEEAVQAHLILQAKYSIGMHFGTFQLSDEGIDQPIKDLDTALTKHQLSHKDFIILQQGECKIFK